MNVKFNISADENLIARADAYAEKNYMTRSGLVSLALTQFLNQNDIVQAVQDIAFYMRKIADNQTLSEEEMNELKDFVYLPLKVLNISN